MENNFENNRDNVANLSHKLALTKTSYDILGGVKLVNEQNPVKGYMVDKIIWTIRFYRILLLYQTLFLPRYRIPIIQM